MPLMGDFMQAKMWYIVSTNDRLQLPLFYAVRCEDVANWIGCGTYAIFTAFARAKKKGRTVVSVMGFTIERQVL